MLPDGRLRLARLKRGTETGLRRIAICDCARIERASLGADSLDRRRPAIRRSPGAPAFDRGVIAAAWSVTAVDEPSDAIVARPDLAPSLGFAGNLPSGRRAGDVRGAGNHSVAQSPGLDVRRAVIGGAGVDALDRCGAPRCAELARRRQAPAELRRAARTARSAAPVQQLEELRGARLECRRSAATPERWRARRPASASRGRPCRRVMRRSLPRPAPPRGSG